MYRTRLLPLLALLGVAMLLFAGCGDATPASTTAVAGTNGPATAVTPVSPTAGASTALATGETAVKPDDAAQARLRVAQCVYGAPDMDVYIDGKVPADAGIALSNVSFSGTRYEYLAPGRHQVAVVPMGAGMDKALLPPLDVQVDSGHRYTVVVLGQQSDSSHKALLIDETAALRAIGAQATDVTDIAVNNLKGAQGLDYSVSGGLRQSNITYGGFAAAVWPASWTQGDSVALTGASDKLVVKEDDSYFNTPGIDNLDCWGGSYPGQIGTDYDRTEVPASSSLNTIEFLRGLTAASKSNGARTPSLSTFLADLSSTGLSDTLDRGGPYLVFAPRDTAFHASLPPTRRAVRDEALVDPKALSETMRRHIVPGYYPPGTLVTGNHMEHVDRTLTNLLGEHLVLSDANSFTINGDDVGDQAYAMVANGNRVFYDIYVVLLPEPQ